MKMFAPEFWYQQETPRQRLLAAALLPAGVVYGWGVRRRFDMHVGVPMQKPVICVGNVTMGGAGKTPVALSLSVLLKEAGYNPHFLTRGYGGTEAGPLQVSPGRDTAADVGDEALLLVEEAPTWVSVNRPLGAQLAMDTGANVIVMDDGFQNPLIYKDLSLLVVDGGAGFGNGNVFPAGPLREALSFGISRADAIVIVGEDQAGAEEKIRGINADVLILKAKLQPDENNADLQGQKVHGFAGIGRPEKFRQSLLAAGADVTAWHAFPDHFVYTEENLKEIFKAAEIVGETLVTTTKDFVRLPMSLRDQVSVFAVNLVWDDPAQISDLFQTFLKKR